MKILHTSDWHLGKNLYDFSLLADQRQMIDFLLVLIESEEIGAVIIAGDIYDRPIPSAEAVRLYDYFLTRAAADMGVPVIAVAGNHDSASRLEFGSSLYSGSGYYVFGAVKPVQKPVILRDDFGDVNIFALPWLHPAEIRVIFEQDQIKTFDDAYRFIITELSGNIDPSRRNIAVAHGFFAGISAREEKSILTSDSEINVGGMDIADSAYFSEFDYVALGHLHAPQKAGGEMVRYSGSPLKYSLSEEKQKKSCNIIELGEKGDVQIKTVAIPAAHDVRSITGRFDELMEPTFHENKNFEDFVFANISDSGILYPMEKLRTLFPNMLGLRFVSNGEAMRPLELQAINEPKLSVLELFQRFYKDVNSVEMPQPGVDFVREILERSEVEPK